MNSPNFQCRWNKDAQWLVFFQVSISENIVDPDHDTTLHMTLHLGLSINKEEICFTTQNSCDDEASIFSFCYFMVSTMGQMILCTFFTSGFPLVKKSPTSGAIWWSITAIRNYESWEMVLDHENPVLVSWVSQ